MKRRDLISQLRDAANGAALEFRSLRNTGGHEVFSLDRATHPGPEPPRDRGRHGEVDHAPGSSQARRGAVDMTSYRVTATRDGDWWSLVAVDVDRREFEVDITPDLDRVEVSGTTLELLARLPDREAELLGGLGLTPCRRSPPGCSMSARTPTICWASGALGANSALPRPRCRAWRGSQREARAASRG